jgi:predicted transcriptional regulator
MSLALLYDQYGSDLRDLFSSAINIKILLLLSGQELSVEGLCAETGHVHPAVQPRIRQLEEHGLVIRTDRSYALTTLGTVLAAKIVGLFSIPADPPAPPTDGGEGVHRTRPRSGHPPAVLDRYAAHMKEINLVVRSGIRTRMLLALSGGKTDRYRLREVTGCCSSNFRTNMRSLIEAGLVREQVDGVVLTPRGEALASQVAEIVPLYGLILKHREFWRDHELRNLPGFALDSIGSLVESEIIRDSSVEFFKTYEHYLGIIAGANRIHGITSMANPGIAAAIAVRVIEGVPAEIIVPPDLARHLYEEPYRKQVEFLSTFPHFQFRVTDLPLPPGITVTDAYLSMKLFFTGSTTYDLLNGFVSTSPEGRAWGERLFAYYREHSVPIGEFMEGRESGE